MALIGGGRSCVVTHLLWQNSTYSSRQRPWFACLIIKHSVRNVCPTVVQVPLPKLPMSHLDLSAFLADADARASMYKLPPVSLHSHYKPEQQQLAAVKFTFPEAAAPAATVQLEPKVLLRQQPHNIAPAGASMPTSSSPVSDRPMQPALIATSIKATASSTGSAVPAAATVARPVQLDAAAGSVTSPAADTVAGECDNVQQHPNLATAGVPAASGPLAILQITLQVCQPV
jgi:hypothetical protein